MGNWRRVQIIGTCDKSEIDALVKRLTYNLDENYQNFGPLCISNGLCGLGSWPAEKMNIVGNLAERDYDPEDVATHLMELSRIAPSLNVVVHCGADYEKDECIASVTCFGQIVHVHPPMREEVPHLSDDLIKDNIYKATGVRL